MRHFVRMLSLKLISFQYKVVLAKKLEHRCLIVVKLVLNFDGKLENNVEKIFKKSKRLLKQIKSTLDHILIHIRIF